MPQHMTLTPFEWILVVCLAVITWYMIRRDFASRDALAATVQALSAEVAKLRTHLAENYVNKADHREALARLRDDIEAHAERFTKELDIHRTDCPGRLG